MNLVIVWDDIRKISGVGAWILQALERLPKLGVQAILLDIHQSRRDEVDVSAVANRIVGLTRPPKCGEHAWHRLLREKLLSLHPDVVMFHDHRHAEDVLDCLPEGFPAMDLLHLDRPDPLYEERVRVLAARGVRMAAVSPAVRGRAGGDTLFLPLGIDLPKERRSVYECGGALRVCYVGRLMQQQKRVLDLPRFVRALADAGQAVDFRVYGEGPDRPALEAALRDAGVSGSVRFEGALPRPELCKALTRENFILFCSEYEGLPLSLLEACARGVVPVATDIRSGIGDLLADGRDAVLYPVGEPETGAKKLLALLAKPGAWESMRAATQEVGRRFEFSSCLEAIVKALASETADHAVDPGSEPSKAYSRMAELFGRFVRK